MKIISICCAILCGMLAIASHAGATGTDEENWPELSLGDLMKVGVESASRKSQSVSNTAAAAFVISAADIKRSGALSIPEALRLAPGVEAARLSNNKWAVSIRGFNGRMANKLLVMVDGRSIYSSLYGGVVWEAENIPLEEISRIEVIRGSAGLAWGSNAVNGVVNIITKRAQDTAGWLVDTHAGTSTGKAGMAVRYGAKMEDGSAFRVTVSDQQRDGGKEFNGKDAQDQWNDSSLSFRYDKPDGVDTRWLFSGRVFDSQMGEPWLVPTFNTAATYNMAQYGTTSWFLTFRTRTAAICSAASSNPPIAAVRCASRPMWKNIRARFSAPMTATPRWISMPSIASRSAMRMTSSGAATTGRPGTRRFGLDRLPDLVAIGCHRHAGQRLRPGRMDTGAAPFQRPGRRARRAADLWRHRAAALAPRTVDTERAALVLAHLVEDGALAQRGRPHDGRLCRRDACRQSDHGLADPALCRPRRTDRFQQREGAHPRGRAPGAMDTDVLFRPERLREPL